MRRLAVSMGFALLLACGDNPPKTDDEGADASGTQGSSESGDAEVDESASEATSSTESGSTEDADASTSTDDADTETTTGDTDTTETADATETTETTDETTDGDPDPVAVCLDTCVDIGDCALPQPLYDEDNWTCFEGGCQWLGCKDGECGPGQVCHDSGEGVATCVTACMTTADCDQGIGPYVEANYTCDAGACVFLGCAADSECEELGFGYVCTQELAPPTCVAGCRSPQDCASPMPAFNVDNWSCDSGACIWLGCNPGECGKTKVCAVLLNP